MNMGIYNHTTILGFQSWREIFKQMFKYHQMRLSLLINISIAMTLIFLTVPLLEEWLWSPLWTLFLLIAVIILDFISAVASNWEKDKGLKTEKAIKVPVTIAAYIILLAIMNSLGKAVTAFEMDEIFNPVAFDYMAKSVYFLCFSINFISALKHMSNLGLIPKPVAKFIERFIDTHKNRIEEVIDNKIISPQEPGEAPSKSEK